MLHEFLAVNRAQLVDRCRVMVAKRSEPKAADEESAHGIPVFLDQIIETLRLEQTSDRSRSSEISGVAGGGTSSQIGDIATLHGRNLLDQGFTLEQVVRDYGDVCQAVTDLAYDLGASIEVDEFRTFNRCIDNAIASAVNAYALHQAAIAAEDNVLASNSRMGSLVHELRNYLHIVTYAVRAIKTGDVGIGGATGAVLDRSLIGMHNLIDRSLTEVRLTAGAPPRTEAIRLDEFLRQAQATAIFESQRKKCQFNVGAIDEKVMVTGDPEILHAAVFNLLQNAFKFTKPQTTVSLQVHAADDRVLIEVEDQCGGLAPGVGESLMRPFSQNGVDRSGLGLGLHICRRGVEANNGVLRVRDVPGSGCVFTIDLPRRVT